MKLIRIHCHSDQVNELKIRKLAFHPDLLSAYAQMGIIEIEEGAIRREDLHRLQRILRLKRNCGVNTVGATIIVDLLDKIERLQDEIDVSRRK